MRYYPMFVNLEQRSCLVVGAGQVGRRKIETLLSCGADRVLVVDLAEPDPYMAKLLARPGVSFERREFRESDLDGAFLVIASTSSEEVNWRISRLCAERGILCNIVDQPEKCSFIVPAVVSQGDLTVAISTGGASPALAKRIRRNLEDAFGEQYGRLLIVMGRVRPLVLGLGLPSAANSAVFRALVASSLLDTLAGPNLDAAASVLGEVLPKELLPNIPELLDGLA